MKILTAQEYITEKLGITPVSKTRLAGLKGGLITKPKEFCESYSGEVFAFKNTNSQDRDCVAYVETKNGKIQTDISGQIIIEGANYSSRLDKDADYSDYETVLSEVEFEAFKEDHCPEEMLTKILYSLLSDNNDRLIEKVKEDELNEIANSIGISKNEAKNIVDDYPLQSKEYFDRGICSYWKDMEDLLENLIFNFGNEKWLVDYLKNGTDDEEILEYLDNIDDTGSDIDINQLKNMGYDFSKLSAEDLDENYITLDSGKIIEYHQ